MGDLLGSLVWGAKSGQYCVIGGGSLQNQSCLNLLVHDIHVVNNLKRVSYYGNMICIHKCFWMYNDLITTYGLTRVLLVIKQMMRSMGLI
jgi:hypothetical protein